MSIHHFLYPVSCVLPASPLNGVLLNNSNLTERSVIILQCDPEFSLVGAVTVTYNNSALCDPDPALLECMCLSVMPACMYAAELPIDGASAILVLLLLEVKEKR